MNILDGKALSNKIEHELSREIECLREQGIIPSLCVILVGDDPASISYVNMKNKACNRVGIKSKILRFDSCITQEQLLYEIENLNNDRSINGILVQLPLPSHINTSCILESVSMDKDVDGFHSLNIGRLCVGINSFVPATPLGIMMLLKHYEINLEGLDVAIIGASNIVGKPLALLMLNAGATVSICHKLTEDISKYTLNADIICVGVGKPKLIHESIIKDGAIVIDIGINKLCNGSIVGDVDFEGVHKKTSYITPVPGGVGPMTIAALLSNTIRSTRIQYGVFN